ncbi:MAG: hypothetical protein Q4E60_11355, partial [Bacteroidales bacterium]|nr:hypothetical protein [Bacteroidales bacterium]
TSLPQFEVSLYRMDDWLCVHMNSFDENGELIPYYEIDPNGLNSYTIDIPYLDYDYLYDQVAAQTKDLPDNSAFWDHHAGDFASTFWNLTKQLFGITWPGTKVSILGIYLSCVATVFVISLVHRFVGFSFTISPHTSARSLAESYRSSSKSDYNISKEREGDEI